MPQRKEQIEIPEELEQMFAREGITPVCDGMGPRLTMKMSGELYMAVANFRRARFLESRPKEEREKLASDLLFD